VPQKTHKRRRGASSDPDGARRRAVRPGEVWAIDFQFDATNDARLGVTIEQMPPLAFAGERSALDEFRQKRTTA